jgi:hypothetical protein
MNTQTIPEDTTVLDAGQQAAMAGLHLICNGRESKVSPFVPPGWFRVAVKIKPASASAPDRESLPCAA